MISILLAMASGVAGPPAPPASESLMQLGTCQPSSSDDRLTPEAYAWASTMKSNRLDDFRSFAARYPQSACARAARQWVAARERTRAGFAARPANGARPAMIVGNGSMNMRYEDYPTDAMLKGEQGVVSITYEIAPDGMAESCRILESSGSAALDEASCELIIRRGRFRPARDAAGAPIRSKGDRRIRWELPPSQRTLIPGWNVSVKPRARN
jgi:TonB family protein